MLQTKVKRKTYQEKIKEFNELYSPFEFIECVESQDGWCCEACGSHAPGHFFLYEDKNGRTRHVGGVCHEKLITTWRGRCEGCRCIRIVTKIEVRLPHFLASSLSQARTWLIVPLITKTSIYTLLFLLTKATR